MVTGCPLATSFQSSVENSDESMTLLAVTQSMSSCRISTCAL